MTAAWLSAAAETEGVDTGVSPIIWGVGTLIIFLLMLWMMLAFGRGRG